MPSDTTVLAVAQLLHLLTFRLSMVVVLRVLVLYYIERKDKTLQPPCSLSNNGMLVLVLVLGILQFVLTLLLKCPNNGNS